MTFHFRPAVREHTPLIVGIGGPTKSGKTYSAHRIAAGLANGGPVVMINAEGAKGHQYADRFDYIATDIQPPYRPERYTEALKAALAVEPKPAVIIIDSGSHMHDGPGGVLEYHEDELGRLAGADYKKRDRMNFAAWVKPKAAENEFIYTMLGSDPHIILCLRAKEKIKIVKGHDPIDLGWQPIVGERVAFETLFTLMLPPHSKGVPDLSISEMREPFDKLIPAGQPLSEETGRLLGEWARGGEARPVSAPVAEPVAVVDADEVATLRGRLMAAAEALGVQDATQAAIAANDARHALDPFKHVEWLERQVRTAEANMATKAEPSLFKPPAGAVA